MQRKRLTDSALVFLAVWFLLPLSIVLLIDALKVPEVLSRWLGGLW